MINVSNGWKSGLTLVEVMLAVVILGIGAGTLLTATARCLRVATKAKHYSHAHRLIQRIDSENPITRGEIEEGSDSGSFDDGYSWEREIIENEDEEREGLYIIRTRVSWSDRGKTAYEETTGYLYVPPEKELTVGSRKTQTPSSRNPGTKKPGSNNPDSNNPGAPN